MINLTVKTLDSQNHAFAVEDEITIADFKETIACTVNIPADTQRLIYCGRVLQDSAKLKDYDVDGKVIHLVQRPPPSSVLRPDLPEPQPQPHRRVRGLEYVGTVRLPVSGIENTLHSLPIHSLANSRLNVARRMISRAENVINALENPNRQEQPTQNEPQEEATPVFEARVVVPGAGAFNNSRSLLRNPAERPQGVLSQENIESIVDPLINGTTNIDQPDSDFIPGPMTPPLTRSMENLFAAGNESNNTNGESTTTTCDGEASTNDTTSNGAATTSTSSTGNGTRTSDFADILDSLNRVHNRFAPYMDQLTTFMRDDPVVPQQNIRSTQAMINRVSEVCHYLGHAYHSISDIILRVRTAPPRQLLCRPMLIQHSAVVQVDIPIQVEAQVHLPADRNPSTTTPVTGASTTASTTPSTGTTTSTTAAASSSPDTSSLNSILGIPFMPRTGVRVETYRLPLFNNNNSTPTAFRTSVNSSSTDSHVGAIRVLDPRGRAMLNPTTTSTSASGGQTPVQPMDVASAIASSVVNSLNNATTDGGTGVSSMNVSSATGPGGPNNPNVEFFMEVTPESITIDSLETAFVGPGQASNLNAILQEGINPTPPEFIQSIMQMAGQLINRSNVTGNVQQAETTAASNPAAPSNTASSTPSAPPLDATSSSTSDTSVTTSVGAARTIPFQNSQARGNTQTQPTTATHTRSTPRPHVHLAQHTMHAFDPFLPCSSHHVLQRRRLHSTGSVQQPSSTTPNTASTNQEVPVDLNDESPVHSIIRNILSSVRNSLPTTYSENFQTTSTGNSNSDMPTAQDLMTAAANFISALPDGNYLDSRPTIARLLQEFPDTQYVEGESIFTDLVMLLARGFTLGDIMHIVRGQLEPLVRIGPELRNFVVRRILNEDITDLGYESGVEKLLDEMHLFIDHLGLLETRDNIDIIRSVQALLRARLPNIITLVLSDNQNSTRLMFEQIRTTVQQLGALLVKASRNGTDGVQRVCETFLMRFMDGIPLDLQQWSMQATRPQLAEFINTLDVPESLLQRYIVRHIDPIITPSAAVETSTSEPEPMQVEEIVESSTTTDEEITPDLQLSDSEAVGTVVLGSAPWHAQVPSDWVPIIVRDSQRQRRQNHQPPFSDAYLSGMPSKRRKLADCNRPSSSISQIISESVRRAVTATGLTTVAPIETVSQAAATDVDIQAAYRDLLHNRVQSDLEKNEDFTPEQFPNVDSYFNNPRQ